MRLLHPTEVGTRGSGALAGSRATMKGRHVIDLLVAVVVDAVALLGGREARFAWSFHPVDASLDSVGACAYSACLPRPGLYGCIAIIAVLVVERPTGGHGAGSTHRGSCAVAVPVRVAVIVAKDAFIDETVTVVIEPVTHLRFADGFRWWLAAVERTE
nr:hypothetical protein [Pyxidicoccus trucidator]